MVLWLEVATVLLLACWKTQASYIQNQRARSRSQHHQPITTAVLPPPIPLHRISEYDEHGQHVAHPKSIQVLGSIDRYFGQPIPDTRREFHRRPSSADLPLLPPDTDRRVEDLGHNNLDGGGKFESRAGFFAGEENQQRRSWDAAESRRFPSWIRTFFRLPRFPFSGAGGLTSLMDPTLLPGMGMGLAMSAISAFGFMVLYVLTPYRPTPVVHERSGDLFSSKPLQFQGLPAWKSSFHKRKRRRRDLFIRTWR